MLHQIFTCGFYYLYSGQGSLRGKGAVLANLRLGLLAVGALAASGWRRSQAAMGWPWAPTGPDFFPIKVGVKTNFFLKKVFLKVLILLIILYSIYSIWALQVSLLAWLNLLSSQVDFPALTQVFAEQNQCTDRCHSVNQQEYYCNIHWLGILAVTSTLLISRYPMHHALPENGWFRMFRSLARNSKKICGSKVFAIPGLVHHRHDRHQSRVGLWIRPLELETQGGVRFLHSATQLEWGRISSNCRLHTLSGAHC